MRKRLTAALLCLCLLFTLLPATAFAEGEPDSGPQPAAQSALCEHHPSNDESCGYTEGTAGSPCTHQHDEDCYILVTECVHEHGPECYPAESVSENTATPSEPEEAEPSECTHECSEESGCMTKILDCKHEHKVNGGEADREGGLGRDEACGYVSATEGTPCTFVCEVCSAQDSGNPGAPSDAQPEECTCETLCTEEEVNADCPVCSAEGAELDKVCVGIAPMLPVTALAAETNTVYVGSVKLTGSTETPAYATTDATTGKVTTDGATGKNYNIMWDGATLTLRNATIKEAEEYSNKSSEKIAIYLASGDMNLALAGVNTVDALGGGSAASCGINLGNGSLTISGEESASLSVFGGDTTKTTKSNSCGIYASGAITIDNGTVNATGESAGGSSYGIHAYNGKIIINGGTVNATSGEAKGDSCGIFAEASDYKYNNSVKIHGGTVTATAGDAVGDGWYSCGIRSEGPITITGGTVNATGKSSKAVSSCGIYAVKTVTISGGTVTATGGAAGSGESSGIYAGTLPRLGELKVLIQDATVTATGVTSSGTSNGIIAESGGTSIQVAIENSTVTATGGSAAKGSYGILARTTGTGTSDVTINDNSVVRANMTGTEGVDGEPIGGDTINRNSGVIFENGVGTVYGNVTLKEDLTIGEGESLTIPEDSSLDMGGHTITVENGGKLDGTPTGNGTVIDKSSPVSYLDENGAAQTCDYYEVVTADDTQWTTGWYVVNSDVTINQRIPVNGDVKLILTDGHTLTVNGGIHVTGGDRFTVYGQENGNGKLTATATNNVGAGIGGNGITTTSAQDGENGGTIVIAGGIIEAVGGDSANDTDSPCGGAGIGNGNGAGSNGGSVTIYGGKVNATGGASNAGIGGDGSTIQILGGTVDATSWGTGAAAIGGTHGTAGTITITDSNVTANGEDSTGIGGGYEGHGGTITITNSTVTAIGGNGAGIGGGSGLPGSAAGGNGGNVTIVNSTVTASSKEGDSIGAGRNGADPGTLTLSPADGKAIAAKAGADEASALTLNGSPFTAKTAVTDLVRGTKYFRSEPCDIHTVTVNDSYAQTTGAGNYAEGATVAIDAGTRSDYTFNGWTSSDGVTFANAGSTQTTFTMPDKAVTVTANWTKKSSGGGGGGSSYDYYTISATAGEGGSISPAGNISVREGRDQTYTITPDGGYCISDVRVDGVSVGTVSSYTFDNVQKRHTIEAIFAKENPDTGNPFTDVHLDDWFYNDVMFVYQNGLMCGTSATTFEPNMSTTRAMIVSILYRQEDEPAVTTDAGFADVVSGAYYEDAVNWAAEEGIVNGYSDTAFGPNDAITREQMAAILMNYAEYKGQDVSARADLSGYADAADVSTWAEESVQWAVSEGLLKGMTDDILAPQGNATRAQVAAILERFLER